MLLEVLGVIIVGGISFAATEVLTLAPLDRTQTRSYNTALFCSIPLAIYTAFRIYFGSSFYISSKLLPDNLRHLGNIFFKSFFKVCFQFVECESSLLCVFIFICDILAPLTYHQK